MSDKSVELAVEIPAETKRAVEHAAAAEGISVSDFVERALRRMLSEAGYEIRKRGIN